MSVREGVDGVKITTRGGIEQAKESRPPSSARLCPPGEQPWIARRLRRHASEVAFRQLKVAGTVSPCPLWLGFRFAPVIWTIPLKITGEAHPCPKRILPCFNSTIYLLMSSWMIELGTITSPRRTNGGSAFCPAGPTQFLHSSLDTVDFTHPVG